MILSPETLLVPTEWNIFIPNLNDDRSGVIIKFHYAVMPVQSYNLELVTSVPHPFQLDWYVISIISTI
jgi:hypothetical protein